MCHGESYQSLLICVLNKKTDLYFLVEYCRVTYHLPTPFQYYNQLFPLTEVSLCSPLILIVRRVPPVLDPRSRRCSVRWSEERVPTVPQRQYDGGGDWSVSKVRWDRQLTWQKYEKVKHLRKIEAVKTSQKESLNTNLD